MANHNTQPTPGFAALQCLCSNISKCGYSPQGLPGLLPVGRPHGLYQMKSNQGNHFSPCGTWIPQIVLPAPRDLSYFLIRHCQALRSRLQTYTPLFIGSWQWFGGTDFLSSPLQVFSPFHSLSLSLQLLFGGVLFLHDPDVLHSLLFSFSLSVLSP